MRHNFLHRHQPFCLGGVIVAAYLLCSETVGFFPVIQHRLVARTPNLLVNMQTNPLIMHIYLPFIRTHFLTLKKRFIPCYLLHKYCLQCVYQANSTAAFQPSLTLSSIVSPGSPDTVAMHFNYAATKEEFVNPREALWGLNAVKGELIATSAVNDLHSGRIKTDTRWNSVSAQYISKSTSARSALTLLALTALHSTTCLSHLSVDVCVSYL